MKKVLFLIFGLLSLLQVQAATFSKDFQVFYNFYQEGQYQSALIELTMLQTANLKEEKEKSLWLSRTHLNLGQYSNALEELIKSNSYQPNLEAMIMFHLDSLEAVVTILNVTASLDLNNDTSHLYLADAQFGLGRYSEALNNYSLLGLTSKGPYVNIYKKMGICRYYLGQYLDAVVSLQAALNFSKTDYQIYNFLGMSYYNLKNVDLAISTLKAGINPKIKASAECAVNLGLLYDDLAYYDKSLKVLMEAIEIDTNRVDAYYYLGNINYNRGNYKESNYYYAKLLELNPKYEYAYEPLANSYFFSGFYEEAIQKYRESSFFEREDPRAYNLIGIAYLQKKEYNKAFSYFEEAIKVSPNCGIAYFNLAGISFRQGLYEEAISYCAYAMKTMPNDPDIYFLLGKIYIQLNMLENAQQNLELAIQLNSLNSIAYRYLGDLALMKNEKRKAEFYYQLYATLEPENFDAFYYLGITQFNLSEFEDAEHNFKKALDLNETDFKARFSLAKTYIKQDYNYEAIEILNELLNENNEQAKVYLMLSVAYRRLNKRSSASYFENKAYRIDPELRKYFF